MYVDARRQLSDRDKSDCHHAIIMAYALWPRFIFSYFFFFFNATYYFKTCTSKRRIWLPWLVPTSYTYIHTIHSMPSAVQLKWLRVKICAEDRKRRIFVGTVHKRNSIGTPRRYNITLHTRPEHVNRPILRASESNIIHNIWFIFRWFRYTHK